MNLPTPFSPPPCGWMVDAQQVTVPRRRSVTFKVRAQARDCAPQPAFTSIVLKAQAFIMDGAETCFIYVGASNVTLKATKGAEECPPDAIPGALLGAEELLPGMPTATTLLLAPQDTYVQPNNPAQDAVRVQQRAAKAAWALSSDVGKDVGVKDLVLQEEASVSSGDMQAAMLFDPDVDFSVRTYGPPGAHDMPTHTQPPCSLPTFTRSTASPTPRAPPAIRPRTPAMLSA